MAERTFGPSLLDQPWYLLVYMSKDISGLINRALGEFVPGHKSFLDAGCYSCPPSLSVLRCGRRGNESWITLIAAFVAWYRMHFLKWERPFLIVGAIGRAGNRVCW